MAGNLTFARLCFVICIATSVPAWSATTNSGIIISEKTPTGSAVVRGRVFADRNSDKLFTPGIDSPLSHITISDGERCVLSGTDGIYDLPVSEASRYVFITRPPDYSVGAEDWWIPLPARNSQSDSRSGSTSGSIAEAPLIEDTGSHLNNQRAATYDFALHPAAEPDTDNFSFVHAADLFLEDQSAENLPAQIRTLQSRIPKPQFCVINGVHLKVEGIGERAAELQDAVSSSPIPLYLLPSSDSAKPFADYFGPDCYSLDRGSYHFVFLNRDNKNPKWKSWLKADLQAMPADRPVILIQNSALPAPLELFPKDGKLKAVLSSSASSTRIALRNDGALADISESPWLSGGIDGSPAGFRVVSFAGSQLNTQFQPLWSGPELTAVYPPGRGTSTVDRLIVSAGSRVQPISKVSAVYNSKTVALKQVSPWSWMAPLTAFPALATPSVSDIHITASSPTGKITGKTANWTGRIFQPAPVAPHAPVTNFMQNAQHSGRCADNPAPPFQLAWCTPTHGTVEFSSPVQYKDRVAIGVRDRDNLMQNGIALLNLSDGRTVKFVRTDSAVAGSVAFGEDSVDGPGMVYAVSQIGTIYRLNAKDGSKFDQGKLDIDDASWFNTSVVVQGKMTICGSASMLQALNTGTADSRWQKRLITNLDVSPGSTSLAGPLAIVPGFASDGIPLRAIEADTGQQKWASKPGLPLNTPAVSGKSIYATDINGALHVFDVETGAETSKEALSPGWTASTPGVDESVVVVPSGGGTVYALARSDLHRLWTFKALAPIWRFSPMGQESQAVFSSPVLTRNFVYFGSSDGRLYCLDKFSGKTVWYFDFGVPTLSTPCITGNAVITAACDGNVYAFTSGAMQ